MCENKSAPTCRQDSKSARIDFCRTTRHTSPVGPQRPIHSAKNVEGSSAEYNRFTNLVDQGLSVPHGVIKRRIEEHRRAAAWSPHRRGPTSKKPSFFFPSSP